MSVAVSTYGRASLLPRLVTALEHQTLASNEFEVVIVDDASPDETPSILEELRAATSLDLRSIRNTSNRGQAAGRNAAWRAARAPLIAFTDDDCVPSSHWLESAIRAFDDTAKVVVGRTMPNPEQAPRLARPFARTITEDEGARFFNTCNIVYRREDLEAVSGFDERFTAHGGEDMDLALRVGARDANVVYAEEALVYHDIHASGFRGAVRDTTRWTGIPQVVARHPELRDLLVGRLFWKPSHPRVLLAAAGIALAPRRPLALLLALPWAWFRLRTAPFTPSRRRRVPALAGGFVLDVLEVFTMIRGSIRHRTVVL